MLRDGNQYLQRTLLSSRGEISLLSPQVVCITRSKYYYLISALVSSALDFALPLVMKLLRHLGRLWGFHGIVTGLKLSSERSPAILKLAD